jgi:SPP1 family phage portal protein
MFVVAKGSIIDEKIIKEAIEANEKNRIRYTQLWDYFLGNHSILNRKKQDLLKNNKIVVNHAKYIVDLNVGYLIGNPVEYTSTKGVDLAAITDQYNMQSMPDIDHEIAKANSIIGKAFDYTYVMEGENNLHTKCIDARNCITIYDDTVEHKLIAAIIYTYIKVEEYTNILLITDKEITEFNSKFVRVGLPEQHSFGKVPVTEYKNNSDEKGDFEDVISLMDAYNIFQSDRVNDKEQLVEAILVLYGFKLSNDQLTQLKENRVLGGLPLKNAGAAAEYLTKQLNETDIDTLRQVLEADIHKISMTPNLSDEKFVGNSSGVAIKFKLIPFEQNTQNKARYFERGLINRFTIYNNYLKKLKNIEIIPPHDIKVKFKRNLPQNDLETSQMINNLKGTVTDETLVAQLSFVEDAEQEVKDAQEEALKKFTDQSNSFATDKPNTNPGTPNNSQYT